jgi:hypothetical protein
MFHKLSFTAFLALAAFGNFACGGSSQPAEARTPTGEDPRDKEKESEAWPMESPPEEKPADAPADPAKPPEPAK